MTLDLTFVGKRGAMQGNTQEYKLLTGGEWVAGETIQACICRLERGWKPSTLTRR